MNRIPSMIISIGLYFLSSTAETFPETYSPYLLCSGVVDYDFILPNDETFASLNTKAIAMMSASWGLINAECKSDMKRLTCAMVYLPSTTKRPCRSLCDATSAHGTTCAGMMEAFGTAVNCSTDLFDPSNDPLLCNSMEATENTLLVAQFTEKYVGDVCQGVIEEILVPSPDSIDPQLAPYLPPYAAQALVEDATAAWVGYLPLMTDSHCQINFRKMACGLKFPIPSETLALSFLFGPIFMPSFPAYDICLNFMDSCHDFLLLAPPLAMDCNATFGDIHLFPKGIQTIANVDLGFGLIALEASPNEMNNVTLTLDTQCPYALAVPDDPTMDKIGWIPGFGCAMACPFRCYTEDEMSTFYGFLSFTQWFTFLCTTLALFNHLYLSSSSKRNLFFSITIVSMWLIAALYILALEGDGSNWQSLTCRNNTVYRSLSTTTLSPKDFSCTFFSIYYLVTYNIFFWIFIAMTAELWCRVVLALKSVTYYRYYYLHGTGVAMLLLTLAQLLLVPDSDVVINGGLDFTCKWAASDATINFYANTLPYTVIYVLGALATAWFIHQLVQVSAQVGKSGLGEIWKTYRTLLISCFLFVGIFPLTILFIQPYYSLTKSQDFTDSAVEWITCMIINFKTTDDKDYLQTCGHYPADRYPVALPHLMWAIFYIFTPLCNIWISYSTEVSAIYAKKLAPFRSYFEWVLILLNPFIKLFRLLTFEVVETSVRSSKIVPVVVSVGGKREPVVANETQVIEIGMSHAVSPDERSSSKEGSKAKKYQPAMEEGVEEV